jgi:predicted O-linked N-acetylglucosamine transferase (SPINDLY family)
MRHQPATPRPATASAHVPSEPYLLAQALYARRRCAESETLCRAILARQPDHSGALSLLGIMLAQSGRTGEAVELLGRAAKRTPESATVHYNLGLALSDLQRFDQALESYERSLALEPGNCAAWNDRGAALQRLRRHSEALASFDRAVAARPDHAEAHANRGVSLRKLERFEDALGSLDRALAIDPASAQAHFERGVALVALTRLDEALASYDRAIAIDPHFAEAHFDRGVTLSLSERFDEARASLERAIALSPNHARAHRHLGNTLRMLRRFDEAFACFARSIAIEPQSAETHFDRGVALVALRRFPEALESFDRALSLGRQDSAVHRYRGAVMQELGRTEEAIASYVQALALDPQAPLLYGKCRHARMEICDWASTATDLATIAGAIEREQAVTPPFVLLSLVDAPALHRKATGIWVRENFAPRAPLPALPQRPRRGKIRIGYFSADFYAHPVTRLAAGLFETHDRACFELTAFSLGRDIRDELRTRVEASFDRFLPVEGHSDREVATLARELEIDIAVDLGGYTRDSRCGIFALRAAPIQVSYLGYLGTMAAQFIDYLIADAVLVPPQSRQYYSEQIAYLPSYQVNDCKRPLAQRTLSRAELGLPASGFVFCSFNASYKITPETFDSWMRILSAVPDSVLFLLGSSAVAERNLRHEALARGVAPQRLIFGRSLPFADYLARYGAADLFLDTLPYNAGTTASDALWAGLPLLTCPGQSFAARMAASLLTAAGLPELIAADRSDYERLAIELATDPQRLARLKQKLTDNRLRCPLFDTATATRNIEALYRQMYDRLLSGLPPEHLNP